MLIDENGKQHGRGSAKKTLPAGVTAEDIVERYLTGASVADVANASGATKWQVEQAVKAAGVVRNGGAQYAVKDLPGARARGYAAEPLDSSVELEVVRVYQAGSSIVETAKTTGVSKYKVEKVVEKYGLARTLEQQYTTGVTPGGLRIGRPSQSLDANTKNRIIDLYIAGTRIDEIADRFNLYYYKINRVLAEAKVARRLPAEAVTLKPTCYYCGAELPVSRTAQERNKRPGSRLSCGPCRLRVHPRTKLIARHGITWEYYDEIFKQQNYGCAICGDVHQEGRALHVDHCHATGVVRGLLCSRCNTGLGSFTDSTTKLESAIRYLQKVSGTSQD